MAEAGSTDLVVAFPDEPLYAALTKMLERDVGRLPVVERNDPAPRGGLPWARGDSFGAHENSTRRKIFASEVRFRTKQSKNKTIHE